MLTVNVICVGKLKEKFYVAAVEEYSKRLSRSCKLNLLELPEERLPETPSDAQIEAALRKEFQLTTSSSASWGISAGAESALDAPLPEAALEAEPELELELPQEARPKVMAPASSRAGRR